MRLYPKVAIVGQSFTGVPSVTVPNQSMTLKDIIARFIRRESLPIGNSQAMYAEGLGDLEKMAYSDITVQMEKADWIREKLSRSSYHVIDGQIVQKKPSSPAPTSDASSRHQTESSQASSPQPQNG